MAYTSYESTKPSFVSTDWPVIIMHGLLGSKANWNAMSKMLHNKTNRKVSNRTTLSVSYVYVCDMFLFVSDLIPLHTVYVLDICSGCT
jgi:hypothetical protein